MKKTVLLVDDSRPVVEIVSMLLRRNDFCVHTANSANEAWQVLECNPVDIIISDVMMPEVDGFAFVKKLKDHPEHRTIPVIYLTALDSIEDEFEGYMSGAEHYIAKPFKARELLMKIKQVLTGEEDGASLFRRGQINKDAAHVLVLSSDPAHREQLLEVLNAEGYQTAAADAVPASLGMLDAEQYKLLVAEVGHEQLGGDDIARFLRSFGIELPVILLREDKDKTDAGTSAYAVLEKAAALDQLPTICREALAKQST